MPTWRILITGSSGLIGSEAVQYFDDQGHHVIGIDNNMRRVFFGPAGDTTWNLERLKKSTSRFEHRDLDIRDREGVNALLKENRFDLIVHCAAQPSHDKATRNSSSSILTSTPGNNESLGSHAPHSPEAVFIFMSTNKVYGDAPNEIPFSELPDSLRICAPR